MAVAFSGPGERSSCAGEEMTMLRHNNVGVNNHPIRLDIVSKNHLILLDMCKQSADLIGQLRESDKEKQAG